ncbi:MAG: ribonuclease III [Legionellales bacterium]|nr:MAG: ribonuclease III [Legionellales bacterium]
MPVKLEQSLSYNFKNKALLQTALTHRSLGANNNQRLEFLGDALLGCCIAQELFQKFPKADEGVLTRIRASLVCKTTLAELAQGLELSKFLILSVGERKGNGHNRPSILADTLEAIIGAIYLDSDIDSCNAWLLSLYKDKLDLMLEPVVIKDPKTRLQELLQAKKLSLPIYNVISSTGSEHNKVFYINCTVQLLTESVRSSGDSIRAAEQNVARKILELLTNV